jgi:hypothetical protein
MYREIIDALMIYCSNLDNFFEMQGAVHLIDELEYEYQYDMDKQNHEYILWQEYENLFQERFKDGEFCDDEGDINEKGMFEYKNFNKINKVLEDYNERGMIDILDSKQNFFLVLDLLNVMNDME